MHGILYPPDNRADWPRWREQLRQWRSATRDLMRYDGSIYNQSEFAWVPQTFSLGFLMMLDQQFYDPQTGQYRIDALLDDAITEFGGYDAIMLWHAYPKIGFDSRNQFDFYRDSVGGLAGLKALVERCHARGVKVYVDYNPWDTGTRREGLSDVEALVQLVTAIDADAIFLDTMSFAASELRARLDETRPGVALESEILVPIEHMDSHPASWAQGLPEGPVPGVLRNKWFERRHMQHRIKRWQHDHSEELHLAWMNGTGVVVWENVFGTDVRWSPRDKSLLRAMLPVQRRYAALLAGEGWEPLVATDHPDLCATLWEGQGFKLWTLCNRSETDLTASLTGVDLLAGWRCFDLIRGEEQRSENALKISLRPRGVGALFAAPADHFDVDFQTFLAQQHQLDSRANFDSASPPHIETLKPAPRTQAYTAVPQGMVHIPAHQFEMQVQFQVRECGFYAAENLPPLDLRYASLHKPTSFTLPVSVAAFALDATPVTNAQFARFLQASGYQPAHPENFLQHWPSGQLPAALEDHPVVCVDLVDMRAYAAWAGKRLPTEAEWQHAAQGFEERLYPWGDSFTYGLCNSGLTGGTTPVTAFPDGRSPFGCYDLCGNVWEMTESERTDGRTRSCILKGGSFYRALGSEWYTDGGPQTNAFSVKLLLSWPGLDRCATIGFRCAADLA